MAKLRVVIQPITEHVEIDTVQVNPSNRILLVDPSLYLTFYAGYSVRKISDVYNGPCMEVRRSSDNSYQDIGFTVGGDLDESALTTFCGAGDGYIRRWYDQGLYQQDIYNDSNSNQPQIVSDGSVIKENGKPAPTTYGGTDTSPGTNLRNPGISILQPSTYFLIGKSSNVTYAHFVDNYYTDYRNMIGCNDPNLDIFANTILTWGGGNKLITQQLVYAFFSGSSSEVGVNGGGATTGNAGTATAKSLWTFSGRPVSPGTVYTISGSIQELRIYSDDDQSGNRGTIESDMNDYFSIY